MDKDQSLDRLLGRASRVRPDARPDGACLDAETLAGWVDGSLPAAQRSSLEAHAADCERCLAVLAAIATTEPPPSRSHRPSWLSVRWLVPLATAALISVWVFPSGDGKRTAPPAARPVEPPRASAPEPPQERDAAANNGTEPRTFGRRLESAQQKAVPNPSARDGAASVPSTAPRVAPPVPPAAAAAPAASRAAAAAAERIDTLSAADAAPPRIIASPDANVRWRLAGGNVERSTDAGRTWTQQATGAGAPLLGGSSPAPSVCWLVGRAGTVLLTTDGESWRRIEFPDPKAELVGVTARDGRSASVTTADGRTYRTEDGGRTWTLQENPPAPF
jgi:hypothetical protein